MSTGSVYKRGTTWTAHATWTKGGRRRQEKRGGFRTRKLAEARAHVNAE